MSDKHLTFFDSQQNRDEANIHKSFLRGEVIFKSIDTGEVLLTTHNRVVIAGSQFIAEKCFNLPELVHLPTYNESLELENSLNGATPGNIPKICLFCCGTNGCGTENSQVFPVRYTKRIPVDSQQEHTNPTDPNNTLSGIVPFRYQLTQNDLSDELRQKYFGRQVTRDGDRIAYYFKAFESDPKMYMRFVDGTIIDENLYDSQNETDAETYVEMNLRITKDDFRDYFRATSSINDAKINSISLVTAWYNENGGYRWYQDIIPITQLNIPNEPLIDLTKGIDITYHIYF